MTQNNPGENRYLRILYAIVCTVSLAAAALNFIQVYNLKLLEDPKLTPEAVSSLSTGFYTIALLYIVILAVALWAILKKQTSKKLLMILAVVTIALIAFGPYLFDLVVGDLNLKN